METFRLALLRLGFITVIALKVSNYDLWLSIRQAFTNTSSESQFRFRIRRFVYAIEDP